MYKRLREDPSRVVILGAGRGGSALLEMLLDEELVEVVGIADVVADAPGMLVAKEKGVPTFHDVEIALQACAPCVAFNLTENEMVEEIAAGILGAGGVIGGLEAKLIWHMVTRLKTATQELEFQARHDVLTGLHNRRYVMEQFEHEMNQVLRYKTPLSVVMIDLDHFKEVNDALGHAAGDEVLKEVACRLKLGVRAADIVGRWGGEEFLVLLPHANEADALHAAEKWLDHMRSETIKLTDEVAQIITFSAGVASFDSVRKDGMNVEEAIDALLAEADARMYQAKESGRARIVGTEDKHA